MNLLDKINVAGSAISHTLNGKAFPDVQYAMLLNSIPATILYIDNEEKLQYANLSFEKLFDTKFETVKCKTLADFLGEKTYNSFSDQSKKALAGEMVHFETELSHNGIDKILDVTFEPDQSETGTAKGYTAFILDITEKKKSANLLEADQQQLKDYIDNASIGMHWIDSNGIILWANQSELDLLGYTADEYIGHHISEFHADKAAIEDILNRLSSNQTIKQYQATLKCKNGRQKTVLISSNVLWIQEKFVHTRCFTVDITKQQATENALRESEQRYSNLIHGLPVALYTTDKEGWITMYNDAAAELWGRHPEIGKDLWCGSWKIYEPDGVTPLPLEECPMAIALKEGRKVFGKEILVEKPDGVRRNVQPHPEPIFNSNGEIVGAVNMLLDITESKNSEQSKLRLAAIVESSEDAIISKTLDGIITSWNPGAEKLFGYTSEEMIGKPVTKLIPEDRLTEEPMIIERLKKGEKVDHFETKRITKNKTLIDISLTISPIKDSTGKVIGASKIARNITLQKKLYESLRESEERMRMAIESTRLGTWEYQPSNDTLIWSEECRRIYDVPRDLEINFELFTDLIDDQDKEFVRNELQKAMDPNTEGSYDIQYRILRYSDKQPVWIRAKGNVFFDSHRKPDRFIGTILDISDDKEQEEELRESIELFQTMADNVPAMIWMSGTDKFCDFFNKTWLQFTGRTVEEESNEGWLEGVHPDDIDKCIAIYKTSYEEQKGFYTEYRLRRHDGVYRWIADNSIPRFSPNGEFLGFISACMDIDDQKRYREKIHESELLFKTISNASPAALWMTNEDEQTVFVSDTWLRWTGKSFDDEIHRGWIQSVHEEDRETVRWRFRKAFKQKKYFNAEFRFKRTDGEIRWGLTEGYPYFDINDNFSGYAGSVTDITDLKKLEQRKDDFIKMASHELKTPITSISGYIQLLMNIYNELDDQKLQASKSTVRSSLGTISKQVSKLTRLISELLDLSKIESGKLELHKTEFVLSDLVQETVQDVRHTTSKHAIIYHNDFEGNVFADKDRIAQVIMNLLTNAIKYSPDAESVEVFVEGDNKFATIKVRDHGIGIDKKDHLKIFERFYRVEGRNEQTYPGFGIGLFIASEIIHRHHGTIAVESAKGKGSVFTVTLPIETNR